MHQIAQICTYIFKNSSGMITPNPHNCQWVKSHPQIPPLSACPLSHFQNFCGHCTTLEDV